MEEDGSNLRNKLAHGLIESTSFSEGQHLYLWWLVLHLCCKPMLLNESAESNEMRTNS